MSASLSGLSRWRGEHITVCQGLRAADDSPARGKHRLQKSITEKCRSDCWRGEHLRPNHTDKKNDGLSRWRGEHNPAATSPSGASVLSRWRGEHFTENADSFCRCLSAGAGEHCHKRWATHES
ncbi:hypothetical protein KCP76_04415 [Salmonella enterica subsp. enterica serovar Weltevreden]|nr:hypothetical protein KCP76_04415 [Salmonella enterica subsp. enterica serovar Weltevreden]